MRRTIERIRTVIREGRLQRQTPDSIVHAVRSTDAFAELLGRGDRPMLAGMQASPLGRRLLEERPDVLALVADRDRLRSMPDGSLGREYCRFAEGSLVALDKPDTRSWTFLPDQVAISRRTVRPGDHEVEVRVDGVGVVRTVPVHVPEGGFGVVVVTVPR